MERREIFFLTNNTSKNLDDYVGKLARFGIGHHVGAERDCLHHIGARTDARIEQYRHAPRDRLGYRG